MKDSKFRTARITGSGSSKPECLRLAGFGVKIGFGFWALRSMGRCNIPGVCWLLSEHVLRACMVPQGYSGARSGSVDIRWVLVREFDFSYQYH